MSTEKGVVKKNRKRLRMGTISEKKRMRRLHQPVPLFGHRWWKQDACKTK